MRIIATIVLALFAITSAVPAVPAEAATIDEMKAYIEDVALDYDLSPELVMGVVETESSWDAKADNGVSMGLMQLNRNTYPWLAEQVGIKNVDPYNWKQNVRMGCWYLDYLRNTAINEGYTDEDALYVHLIYYNRGVAGGRKWMQNHSMYENGYAKKVLEVKHRLEKEKYA
jgi:soluble lytic murein transglycosylase